MFNWFAKALSFVVGLGQGVANAQNIADVARAVSTITANLVGYVNDYVNVDVWAAHDERNQWHYAMAPSANYFSGNLVQAFRNVDGSIRRIVFTIIPGQSKGLGGSLGRLWGRVQSLEGFTKAIEKQVVTARTWEAYWHGYLVKYQAFEKSWASTWGPALLAVIGWRKHPATLSRLLAPTMTPDVVGQLGRGNAQPLVDQLLRTLAGAAPDVTDALQQATLNVLKSGSY